MYKDGDHLHDIFFQTLKIERFLELAQILMIISVIGHVQADVERGFSINTNAIDVNMKELSIRSKRLVRDHIGKYYLHPATTEITNVLKQSCRAAYQQYRTYLDKEKRRQQENELTIQNRSWIKKLRKSKVRSTIKSKAQKC